MKIFNNFIFISSNNFTFYFLNKLFLWIINKIYILFKQEILNYKLRLISYNIFFIYQLITYLIYSYKTEILTLQENYYTVFIRLIIKLKIYK